MKKWEYIGIFNDFAAVAKHGDEGWELVAVTVEKDPRVGYSREERIVYYMKREKA